MTNQYNVVVIGAGPAGYVAAIRSAQLGQKTAIIEKEALGGVCLNVGCIPSKALLYNAEVAHTLQHRGREFGFSFDNLNIDYQVAYKRSRQIAKRLVKGVGFLMKKNNIDVYNGTGQLTTANSIQVNLNDGGQQTLTSDNIIIATGARARRIPSMEIDGQKVITYREAVLSNSVPKSAVIVGGGPIGVEFAYVWANYGVDVTIVEMQSTLLPNEDPEISAVLEKAYKKLGVKLKMGSRLAGTTLTENGVTVAFDSGETLEVERVLFAIGFQSNIDNIGLETVGLERNQWGGIHVNGHMQTNVPSVYAIGDVVAPEGYMFAHHGSAMGLVAAEAIANHPTVELEYRMLPRCTYCVPQVASFGYTEAQAKDAGYEINVGRFPFQPNGKALGLGEREGFVKIIADKRYGEILGAHMIGPNVTELLPELTLARMAELTAEEVARNVHAHPTLSEAIMEAAHGVEGHPVHI